MGTRCRIALAQICSLPAYATQAVDYLFEPAPPLDDNTPYITPIRTRPGIAALMQSCHSVHLRDLEIKLRAIVDKSRHHKVDLLVFPEYSVPRELLPQLKEAAKTAQMTIVAGSHTVTTSPDALLSYRSLGLDDIASKPGTYVRKAISPVFFRDGASGSWFKRVRSKWETDLVLHDGPNSTFNLPAGGQHLSVDLRICIDALATNLDEAGTDLFVVVAHTPSTDVFNGLFSYKVFREIPCAVANSASVGGSRLYTATPATPSAFFELLAIPEKEEVLLVADVELDSQFRKLGSVRTPTPATLIARAPLLYEFVSDHADVSDYIATVRGGIEAAQTSHLARLAAKSQIPAEMRRQLTLLVDAIQGGRATAVDIDLLLDCVHVSRTAVPFWNRCEQALTLSSTVAMQGLSGDPSNSSLLRAVQAIGKASNAHGKRAYRHTDIPPSFHLADGDARSPFFNRDEEQARIRQSISEYNAVVIQGLPGIGKRALLDTVLKEELPRTPRTDIHCIPDMGAARFIDELSEAIGHLPSALDQLPPAESARLSQVVVVNRAEHICSTEGDAQLLLSALHHLDGTDITVVFVTSRQLKGLDLPPIRVWGLDETHSRRLFEFWCKSFGVDPAPNIIPHLYGHPLAAKLAARLLRDGDHGALDRLKFLRDLRAELIEILLSGIQLDPSERRALAAVAVHRRPVDDSAFAGLTVEDLAAIERLQERFLIDRSDGKISMMPIVRDAVSDTSGPDLSIATYHDIAAHYFESILGKGDRVARFEARDEAFYHYLSTGNLAAARAIGQDWEKEARAAVTDLYRNKDFRRCLEVCEAVLQAKGPSIEMLARSGLCLAKLKRWVEAKEKFQQAEKIGTIPQSLVTGYAETLVSSGIRSEGIAFLEEIIQRVPNDPYPLAALAEAHLSDDRTDAAKKYAMEALDKDPRSLRALDVASRVARREGHLKEAFVLASRAMSLNPVRAERTFRRTISAIRLKYDGTIPADFEEAVLHDR